VLQFSTMEGFGGTLGQKELDAPAGARAGLSPEDGGEPLSLT
jgi:hypothetical protein